MTDPMTDLATRTATEAAYIMLREAFTRIRNQVQRIRPRRRSVLVEEWGARLDDLVIDLASCFEYDPPNPTLYSILFDLGNQDYAWKIVHATINLTNVWFKSWNAMRTAVGDGRNVEVLVLQIEELGSILLFASAAGTQMRKIESTLLPHDHVHDAFKIVADRFNTSLTSYEGLLRRLPKELELDNEKTLFAKTQVFLRI